jgi:hypothetical protein
MTGATKHSGKTIAGDVHSGTRQEIHRMKGGCRRGIVMAKVADLLERPKHWGHEDVPCRAMLHFFAQGAILLLSKCKHNLFRGQEEVEVTGGSVKQCFASINRKREVLLSLDE